MWRIQNGYQRWKKLQLWSSQLNISDSTFTKLTTGYILRETTFKYLNKNNFLTWNRYAARFQDSLNLSSGKKLLLPYQARKTFYNSSYSVTHRLLQHALQKRTVRKTRIQSIKCSTNEAAALTVITRTCQIQIGSRGLQTGGGTCARCSSFPKLLQTKTLDQMSEEVRTHHMRVPNFV